MLLKSNNEIKTIIKKTVVVLRLGVFYFVSKMETNTYGNS